MVFDPKTFDWWEAALESKADTTGQTPYPPIYNDTPMTGTYVLRPSKTEMPKAVIFWYGSQTGALLCKIDGQSVKYGLDIWTKCARAPLEREIYDGVITGAPWPEEIRLESGDSTMTAGPGHNSGDTEKDLASLKGNVDEWIDRIKKAVKLGTPATQADADAVADLGTKLGDLLSDAEDKRKSITDPLYKVWKDEMGKWEWITPSKTYVANAKGLANAFIQAETKRRKDEADAINAKAAEAAAAEAAKAGKPAPAEAVAPVATVQPVTVRAGTRKTVVSAKRKVVKFDDFKAAAAFFCAMDPVPPGILEAVKYSTLQLLNAGVKVPGATIDTETFGR
jgi:hypothetical protein